jgi:hypothetical protein
MTPDEEYVRAEERENKRQSLAQGMSGSNGLQERCQRGVAAVGVTVGERAAGAQAEARARGLERGTVFRR